MSDSAAAAQKELVLLFAGKTGNGKSSSANSIAGEKLFLAECSPNGVTANSESRRVKRFGVWLNLVDTVGIADPDENKPWDWVKNKLADAILAVPDGFNAMVFVVAAGRFTEAEAEAYALFKNDVLGKDVAQHLVVLFTHYSKKRIPDKTAWLSKCAQNKQMSELLADCNGRIAFFDNEAEGKEADDQVKQFLEVVRRVPNRFTCQYFKTVQETNARIAAEKKAREEELERKKKELEEERVRQLEEMKQSIIDAKKRAEQEEKLRKKHEDDTNKLIEANNAAHLKALEDQRRAILASIPPPPKGGKCFVAHSKVTVQRNDKITTIELRDLRVGELVQCFDPTSGKLSFSPIYWISHSTKHLKSATVAIEFDTADAGRLIELTDDHLLLVKCPSTNEWTHVRAADIEGGAVLAVVNAEGAIVETTVTQVRQNWLPSQVLTPLTESGYIVVQGVAASCHSFNHSAYQWMSAPLRLASRFIPKLSEYHLAHATVESFDNIESLWAR